MSNAADDIKGEAEQILQVLQEVEDTEIPGSVKQAVEEGWTLAVDAIQVSRLLAYDADQRRIDRQRVVPLRALLLVLSDMEQDYVNEMVKTPKALLIKTAYGMANIVVTIFLTLPTALVQIVQSRDIIEAMYPFVKRFITQIFNAMGATALGEMVDRGMLTRDTQVLRLRQKFLRQNSCAPRFRVRRKSRRNA